ncbi:MAG: EAL domain-containing protein [Okeania sp. SIO2C9]|uniref:EAL domain-containing protein n=1 Tax=Okeania sp. SIO2C9 TaxID=2607791 RepID=UPI0013BEB7B2|nr:EAL domain-containing protein [Okeania sp. SIO2C9]NEQ73433.1 EAL domain-containing protein [Okeania sp. SIO2C9]
MNIDKSIIFSPCILTPSTSLNEAINLMTKAKGSSCQVSYSDHRIPTSKNVSQTSSCILIVENKKLVGILTERDLVKLTIQGKILQNTVISELMTTPVISLPYEEFSDLYIAYNLMRRHRIRHLPILDIHNYPIGLVTLSSLRQTLSPRYFLRFREIDEVMTRNVIWDVPSTSVMEIAKKMVFNKVSCVLLVEDKSDILIPLGIITEKDIIQFQSLELNLKELTAEQVMSCPLFCLKPENNLLQVYQKMEESRIRRLVITGEKEELLGIITETDLANMIDPIEMSGLLEILQHRVNQLEDEKAFLLEKQGLELHQALEENQFELYYQPQFNLRKKNVFGAEALIRWNSPEKGRIPPTEFIPLAEKIGLIIPLGQWILETACKQIKDWQKEGLPNLEIAINISSKQFHQPNLAEEILNILNKYEIEPQCLKLELTESLLVQNIDMTLEQFKILKKAKIEISIDDFGTGYASLGYLQHFDFNTLKIDRSFVKDIHKNLKNAAITSAIIRMAKQLGFQVVAEGVETQEESDFLYAHGCELIQGYLISRPLSARDFSKFITALSEKIK